MRKGSVRLELACLDEHELTSHHQNDIYRQHETLYGRGLTHPEDSAHMECCWCRSVENRQTGYPKATALAYVKRYSGSNGFTDIQLGAQGEISVEKEEPL